MSFTEIGSVQNLSEIGVCEQSELEIAKVCQLRVVPDPQTPGQGSLSCFAPEEFSGSEYSRSWDPSVNEYNQSVNALTQSLYALICRSPDQIAPNKYGLFLVDFKAMIEAAQAGAAQGQTAPPTPPAATGAQPQADAATGTPPQAGASQWFTQPQAGTATQTTPPAIPALTDAEASDALTGPFAACNPMLDATKRLMNVQLGPEAVQYLTSKFPDIYDGCSTTNGYLKFTTDPSSLNVAIASIRDDINKSNLPANDPNSKALPQGVTPEQVQAILAALENIANQDPIRFQENMSEEQQEMMRVMITVQVVAGVAQMAVMGVLIYIQVKAQNRMIALQQQGLELQRQMIDDKAGGINNALERYGRNLNEEYRTGRMEPVNTELRAREIALARNALMMDKSVVFTGQPGVGKTAIAEGLAAAIEQGLFPELANVEIVMLDINKLESGTKFRGQFEQRLQAVLDEVKASGTYFDIEARLRVALSEFQQNTSSGAQGEGPYTRLENILKSMIEEAKANSRNGLVTLLEKALNEATAHKNLEINASIEQAAAETRRLQQSGRRVIPFIDELHRIIGAGSAEGHAGAAEALKTPLARGELVILGATTTEEYARDIASDRAFAQRFVDVPVRAPTAQETVTMLQGKLYKIGAPSKGFPTMEITPEALQEVTRLCERYIPNEAFPRKADSFLKEAVAFKRLQSGGPSSPGAGRLTAEDVRKYFDLKFPGRRGPDDPNPPAAPAADGGGAPAGAPSGAPSGASARMIEPWVLPANSFQLTVTTDPSLSFQARTEQMVAQIKQAVTGKVAVAVTPEGFMFRVSVEGEDLRIAPTDARSAAVLSESTGSNWWGIGSGIVGGLIAGTIALIIIDKYEETHGHPMPWYGEALAFLGTGVGISIGETLAMGAPVSLTSIAYGIPMTLPASIIGFSATSRYGELVGITDRSDNRWFAIGTGSVLIPFALAAEFGGGMTAGGLMMTAAQGGSWLALGQATLASAGATAAVGGSFLAGYAIGYGIDEGLGELGVCNSDESDCSLTGYLAEKMAETWDWCPDDISCYNPINWFI